MSTIDGIMRSAYGNNSASAASQQGSQGMSINDFYKVLAAQLKYQDADNPMNTSEMMAQMVQTQMIEAITQMNTTNTITYASSMIGKEITVAEIDQTGRFTGESTKGVVTGILMGDSPIIYIGEKGYLLAQIMTIGEVPEPKDPDDAGDSGDSGDSGGSGGDDGNTETN